MINHETLDDHDDIIDKIDDKLTGMGSAAWVLLITGRDPGLEPILLAVIGDTLVMNIINQWIN